MRTAWWVMAAAVLAGGAACPKPSLSSAEPQPLNVSPVSLDFGAVYVGSGSSRVLTLSNPARVAKSLQVLTQAPFSSDQTGVTVNGGDAVTLSLRFEPTSAGAFDTQLVVDGTTVALHGAGLEPLICQLPAPCNRVTFDAEAGVCRSSMLPDDSSCSSNCVSGGTCSGGTCRGAFATCDDSNACTVDACAESVGCSHPPVMCPRPSDPCLTAACDGDAGCITVEVPDGVSCGEVDCVANTARVCINGACQTRMRPAGGLCFTVIAGTSLDEAVETGPALDTFIGAPPVDAMTDRFGNTSFVMVDTSLRQFSAQGIATRLDAGVSSPVAGGATDGFGNVYVLDANGTCVKRISPQGMVSLIGGVCGRPFDPQAPDDHLLSARGFVALPDGTRFSFEGGPSEGGVWRPLGHAPLALGFLRAPGGQHFG